MRNEKNQSQKQELSPSVAALMALTLMGLGLCGYGPVASEIETGKAYTLAVVFGEGTKVHRDISPVAFWFNLGWQILAFGLGIALGLGIFYAIFANYRRRITSQK